MEEERHGTDKGTLSQKGKEKLLQNDQEKTRKIVGKIKDWKWFRKTKANKVPDEQRDGAIQRYE